MSPTLTFSKKYAVRLADLDYYKAQESEIKTLPSRNKIKHDTVPHIRIKYLSCFKI